MDNGTVKARSPLPHSYKKNQSIFIWLDILGFSFETENENEYPELSKMLKTFYSVFETIDDVQLNAISDGIVIHSRISNVDNIRKILLDIGKRQLEFIATGNHFIRGGIACGTKLEDEKGTTNQFVSNGLARAYKMESTCIDWPIIGTNEIQLSTIRENLNIKDVNETFGLRQTYNFEGEKIYFVDFIPEHDQTLLNKLYANIEKYFNKPKIRQKYMWLLEYYSNKFDNNFMAGQFGSVVQ